MNNLVLAHNIIPAMSDEAIDKVVKLEEYVGKCPQVNLPTFHTLHGGVYTRTLKLPVNAIVVGALIKIPTTIIIEGNVVVYMDGAVKELIGYNVFVAEAHRKQAVVAKSEVNWTMILHTEATTIREAEQDFTDEYEKLMSNKEDQSNTAIITGVR